MKVFITDQHRLHFKEKGLIAFEGLLSKEKAVQWYELSNKALGSQSSIPGGRMLWRQEPAIFSLVRSHHFGQIAADLVNYRPLRLGVDGFFAGFEPTVSNKNVPLQDIIPYSSPLCGLLIRLKGVGKDTDAYCIPKNIGDGVFLSVSAEINVRDLLTGSDAFVLLSYVSETSRYIHRDLDPHRHSEKRDGYASGDRLKDREHPILYR